MIAHGSYLLPHDELLRKAEALARGDEVDRFTAACLCRVALETWFRQNGCSRQQRPRFKALRLRGCVAVHNQPCAGRIDATRLVQDVLEFIQDADDYDIFEDSDGPTEDDPTPKEIAAACEAIQSTWSENQRQRRLLGFNGAAEPCPLRPREFHTDQDGEEIDDSELRLFADRRLRGREAETVCRALAKGRDRLPELLPAMREARVNGAALHHWY